MSLPADAQLLPNTVHFKEFYGGFHGTCGEAALAAALICAERLPYDRDRAVQLMLDITHEMQALGWASANGASTLWSLAREASQKRGATILTEWDYAEPFPHDWHALFLANAAVNPVLVQLANAQALPGDEAGVHYHFVCIVGRCSAGYVVMDGDNWQIEQQLVVYSYQDFVNAVVCGVLVLQEQGAAAGPRGAEGGPAVIVIDKDASGRTTGAHDDHGNAVGAGIAADIAAEAGRDPSILQQHILVRETYAGAFSGAVISGWDGTKPRYLAAYSADSGIHRLVDFAEGAGLVQALFGAAGQESQLQGEVAALQAQNGQLQSRVNDLEAKLAAAQQSAGVPADVKSALTSAANALQPQGAAYNEVVAALKELA